MLDENSQLIQTIQEYQSKGKPQECIQCVHLKLIFIFKYVEDMN